MNTTKATRKVAASARKAQAATAQRNVELAAMKGSEGQRGEIAAVQAAIGKVRPDSDKPADKLLFVTTRHSFQTGRMGDTLFALSNLPIDERLAKARQARDAADASGKGKLATGQRRRTKAEQAAYDASRQAWSRLLRAAGLVTSDKRGGANNAKPKASPVKGKTVEPKRIEISAADAAKYVPPKSADPDKAAAFVRQQAAMLLAYVEASNQRAMKASSNTLPLGICTAVAEFKAAIDKIK